MMLKKGAYQVLLFILLVQSDLAQAASDLIEAMDNPKNWAYPRGQYNNHGYSTLNQISTSNVDKLKLAWTFATGVNRGHEGAPLVINDVMYVHTGLPNNIYALDLNSDQKILWSYFPKQDSKIQAVFCCGGVSRGLGFGDGKVFLQQNNGQLVALDAKTGSVVWQVQVNDPTTGATNSNAPQVIKDKVLTGCSGGEFGVRCFIAAYYLKDGSLAWKAYSIGPDEEVLIGRDFNRHNPQYSALSVYQNLDGGKSQGTSFIPLPDDQLEVAQKDLGIRTWLKPQQEKDGWQHGGGAVTGYFSFDPKTNLVYYGTGNPGVWNPEARPGDNKWASSVFARDADTGFARWGMQVTPHDEWDFDATNEVILFDKDRKTYATQINSNGFIYTWQANNGDLVLAEKVHPYINWASHINLKTGVPAKDSRFGTRPDVNVKGICPGHLGVKGLANPAAYSPKTKLIYTPLHRTCMAYEAIEYKYSVGKPWVGATVSSYRDPERNYGGIAAIDPLTNKLKWYNKEQYLATSGVLATAGSLVFYSAGSRWFKAVHANTGELLWTFQIASPTVGNPFSYSYKGKQYIGVTTGLGGEVTSFWGEPVKVACTPGVYDASLEKGYAREFDHIRCNSLMTTLGFASGGVHVFSL